MLKTTPVIANFLHTRRAYNVNGRRPAVNVIRTSDSPVATVDDAVARQESPSIPAEGNAPSDAPVIIPSRDVSSASPELLPEPALDSPPLPPAMLRSPPRAPRPPLPSSRPSASRPNPALMAEVPTPHPEPLPSIRSAPAPVPDPVSTSPNDTGPASAFIIAQITALKEHNQAVTRGAYQLMCKYTTLEAQQKAAAAAERDELARRLARISAERDALAAERDAQRLVPLQQKNAELQQQNSRLEQEKSILVRERDALRANALPVLSSALTVQNGALKNRNNELVHLLGGVVAERNALLLERDPQTLATGQQKIAELEHQNSKLVHLLGGVIAVRDALLIERDPRTLVALQEKNAELADQNSTLEQEKTALMRERYALRGGTLHAQNVTLTTQNETLKNRNDELLHQRDGLQREKEQLVRDTQALEQSSTALEAERHVLVGECEALKLANDVLTKKVQSLKPQSEETTRTTNGLDDSVCLLQTDNDLRRRRDQKQGDTEAEGASLSSEEVEIQGADANEGGSREVGAQNGGAGLIIVKQELPDDLPIGSKIRAPKRSGYLEVIDLTLDTDNEEDERGIDAALPSSRAATRNPSSTAAGRFQNTSGLAEKHSGRNESRNNVSLTSKPFESSSTGRPGVSSTRSVRVVLNDSPNQNQKAAVPGNERCAQSSAHGKSSVGDLSPNVDPLRRRTVREPLVQASLSGDINIAGIEIEAARLKDIVMQYDGSEDATDKTWGRILATIVRNEALIPDSFPVERWPDTIGALREYCMHHLFDPEDLKVKSIPGRTLNEHRSRSGSTPKSLSYSPTKKSPEEGHGSKSGDSSAISDLTLDVQREHRSAVPEPADPPSPATSLPPKSLVAIIHTSETSLNPSPLPISAASGSSPLELFSASPHEGTDIHSTVQSEEVFMEDDNSPLAEDARDQVEMMLRVKTEEVEEEANLDLSAATRLTQAHIKIMCTYSEDGTTIICNPCSCTG
ncbi:hypothetical protein FB451DRAFT_489917 [Mycena latifolia]|nr:hypothetical protein FB451DRAFT_489917 [Mycena latifolia]